MNAWTTPPRWRYSLMADEATCHYCGGVWADCDCMHPEADGEAMTPTTNRRVVHVYLGFVVVLLFPVAVACAFLSIFADAMMDFYDRYFDAWYRTRRGRT
jgi:hypothetical protein